MTAPLIDRAAQRVLRLFHMKHSAAADRSTPAQRKARVAAVVADAKAAGEKVPRGLRLIGFQDISPVAHAHAEKLLPLARKVQSRGRAATA